MTIFNVPIGEPRYVEEILRNKAIEVAKVTMDYVSDLEEEYPHELWTMLHYSLQQRVTYWLRTCPPDETKKMAEIMDAAIIDAAIGIDVNADDVAKMILRLPARLKRGRFRSMADLKRTTFLCVILDILSN